MTPAGDTWQIDFCSRPLLDDRKKKVWELNVCDSQGGLRFQRYFANNQVNSGELRRALEDLCSEEGVALPARALFFRMQMQTFMTRALTDLGWKPYPAAGAWSSWSGWTSAPGTCTPPTRATRRARAPRSWKSIPWRRSCRTP